MILSDREIWMEIQSNRLKFTPNILPEQVSTSAVDLRLGTHFTVLRDAPTQHKQQSTSQPIQTSKRSSVTMDKSWSYQKMRRLSCVPTCLSLHTLKNRLNCRTIWQHALKVGVLLPGSECPSTRQRLLCMQRSEANSDWKFQT